MKKKMSMLYMRIQLRFPLRCFALGLRPSFNDEDLLPPLFVPLPPFLFFRPLRSLRVRSFCKDNNEINDRSEARTYLVHIYEFLVRECRKLLRHLVEFWQTFVRRASIMMQRNLLHTTDRLFEWVNLFYFLPLNEMFIDLETRSLLFDNTYKP